MRITTDKLLDALQGGLPEEEVAGLKSELATLSGAEVRVLVNDAGILVSEAGIQISGDGNIIGNNNISIVAKGPAGESLAAFLQEMVARGRSLHQLPTPAADFVGRSREISRLTKAMKGGCIACISGLPGVGKTELALHVADKLCPHFPDAQLFMELGGTSDHPRNPADVLASCIRAFLGRQTRLPQEEDGLGALYRSVLNGKKALIVLDNAAGYKQVKPLLPPSGCSLLVTSRSSIPLPGSKRISLEQLSPREARQLLQKIAPHVSVEEADEIALLCGYLPLALRAAGSLLIVTEDLAPSDYAVLLREERSRLERIGSEGVDLGVEASFNLSYIRLPPETQETFTQLSVFPGSFDYIAEESICKDGSHQHLSALVRLGLVQYRRSIKRYWLHDLMRLFSAQPLDLDKASREAIQSRFMDYYLSLAESIEPLLSEAEAGKWLEQLELEYHNLKAALEASVHLQDQTKGLKLCNALRFLWDLHGYWVEGSAYATIVIKLSSGPVSNTEYVKALHVKGILEENLSHHDSALQLYKEGLEIARQIGDQRSVAMLLNSMGNDSRWRGDWEQAVLFYSESLKLWEALNDDRQCAACLCNLGIIAQKRGDRQQAWSFYHQALAIRENIRDVRGVSNVLQDMGYLSFEESKYDQSIEFSERSLKIKRELKDRKGVAGVLLNLGIACYSKNDVESARSYYDAALSEYEALHYDWGRSACLNNLGNVADDMGDYETACLLHQKSLELRRKIGDQWSVATSLNNLGNSTRDKGDAENALKFLEESLEIRRRLGNQFDIASTLKNLAETALKLNKYDEARAWVAESLQLVGEKSHVPAVAICLTVMAELEALQGHTIKAARLIGAAEKLKETRKITLPPADQNNLQRILEDIELRLGRQDFTKENEVGKGLSLEQAIEYAILQGQ